MILIQMARFNTAFQLFGVILLALLQTRYAQSGNTEAFDCMIKSFEVYDLGNVSTLNTTSDCQLFGVQELIRLLAEHPVWLEFNEISELYEIQVLSYCEALEADLLDTCLQDVYWPVIETISLRWESALGECQNQFETVEALESFMWTQLQSLSLDDLSNNSTLYILRATAALRPGGPFGQILGIRPPHLSITDEVQVEDVKKYHTAFCNVNENKQFCWHSYVSPFYTWHSMGQPYLCSNYESWGCCYADVMRALFIEGKNLYVLNLNVTEYSPGPIDNVSSDVSLADIMQDVVWPKCEVENCSSIEFSTLEEDEESGHFVNRVTRHVHKNAAIIAGVLAGLVVIACIASWALYRREKSRNVSAGRDPESPTADYKSSIQNRHSGESTKRKGHSENATLIKPGSVHSNGKQNGNSSRGESLLARSRTLRPGIGFLSTIQEGEFMRSANGNEDL